MVRCLNVLLGKVWTGSRRIFLVERYNGIVYLGKGETGRTLFVEDTRNSLSDRCCICESMGGGVGNLNAHEGIRRIEVNKSNDNQNNPA